MPRQPRHPDGVSHMTSGGCGYEGVEGALFLFQHGQILAVTLLFHVFFWNKTQ